MIRTLSTFRVYTWFQVRLSQNTVIHIEMILSEINIYPIKSLAGISVHVAHVEDRGLAFDRRWMLIDEKRQFITQREFPVMATINVAISDGRLYAQHGGLRQLEIPAKPTSDERVTVKIWSSSVKARPYESDVNRWFSEILGTPCRLVLMPEETKRKVNPLYAVRRFQDTVSFADGYPFLLIGESSLADLNSRLETPLPMNRFRPNLVVSGGEAFAEDRWKKIRVGETTFHVVKPCARCVITTVDQTRGEKDGNEPLKTLATYRNKNGKVLFGQNLIAETAGGTIRVGDVIDVLERR